MQQFQVQRANFGQRRVVELAALPAIAAGEALLKVEQFAFTANNITYAAAGDMLGYWQFFPPLGNAPNGWGVIPVWGFAEVIESTLADVPVGERLYGYFPPASHVVMQPTGIREQWLFDGAAHRSQLPAGYNRYSRVNHEPSYDKALDGQRMLLWPLHMTSFCLWDKLKSQNWYGAEQLLITSASSKTSIGLAEALHSDAAAPPAIGLTSAGNQSMVDSLGWYAGSVNYVSLAQIDASKATVIVDMAGNASVLTALQQQLGEQLKYCVNVGYTHWDAASAPAAEPGRSELFFAPSHIEQRVRDWGAEAFGRRSGEFLRRSAEQSQRWLQLKPLAGLAELAEMYPQVCQGTLPPNRGLIVRL